MKNERFYNYNTEQIQKNIKILFMLEYLGVHIDNTKEEVDEYGIPGKQIYYFSVPETSTIELEDKVLNSQIKTSDGLIALAKRELSDMVIDSCKDGFGDDDEFCEEIKDNLSNYLKFYAKVRTGETWNKELGYNAVEKIKDKLKNTSGYVEV